jgi:pimeloyl-ACP methyl ester carboxylesterase
VRQLVSLATPHPFLKFDVRFLRIFWHLWFQPVIAAPVIGARLLGRGKQRLPRFLLHSDKATGHTWSEEDIDLYVAQLREPARARAGSLLYRGYIMPEARRIVAGAYRTTRLSTPTRVLYGADDSLIIPDLVGGYEAYADDMKHEFVDGARHFIADQRPDAVVDRALAFFANQ